MLARHSARAAGSLDCPRKIRLRAGRPSWPDHGQTRPNARRSRRPGAGGGGMKLVREHPILIGFVAIMAALVYYWFVYSVYSYRYRLIIEVETPDGLKTGSSVIEARARTQSPGLSGRSVVPSVRGDAVFVDLGDGKNVVGLLASGRNGSRVDAPITMPMEAFKARNCRESMCSWRKMLSMSGRRDLTPGQFPTIVTLGDVNGPETARVIEPGEFESVFGAGYRFKRAWIEMTDDGVTRGIKERLPWLQGFKGVTGGDFDRTWAHPGQNLYASHFMR
jgi:hypothetical protein